MNMRNSFVLAMALLVATAINAQTFTLTSSTVGGQATMQEVFNGFGCTGGNMSPQLSWANAPAGTMGFAITMYDKDYFFVNNPLSRYSISARQNLKPNADGSVDLHIQNESPGADKESNWLPAPEGDFWVVFRTYGPSPQIVEQRWKVPPLEKAK